MIVITPGEPTGIGLDIVILFDQLIKQKSDYPYCIIANPVFIRQRAEQLGLNSIHSKKILAVPPDANPSEKPYVLRCLDIATQYCLTKKATGLITGPVNKKMVNDLGISFQGHTQYLAEQSGILPDQTVMFFESPTLKLALVTDHIPLCQVSTAITQKRLFTVVNTVLNSYFKKFYAGLTSPKIAVCGLNPHAGEGGYLGEEEKKIILPAIQALQHQGVNITGPFSADTLFYTENMKHYDVIIAMYHDQGLSVLKHQYFGQSINITLGLPFLRTSVDHGTAIELAGTGKADPSNLIHVFLKTVELIHETP